MIRIIFLLAAFFPMNVLALTPAHPIGWMHQLPVGEEPGWRSPVWFNVEVQESNVWNAPTTVQNKKTGELYTYTADYVQTSYQLEAGFALGESVGIAVEAPYAHRYGGDSDRFIDDFHRSFGFYRYMRDVYAENASVFDVSAGGVHSLVQTSASGLSSLKVKVKYWLAPKISPACPCGFAVSAHANFPLESAARGLTSDGIDSSLLLHLAWPLGEDSSFGMTGGGTLLGRDRVFSHWPRNHVVSMADMNFDFGLGSGWGLTFSFYLHSPFMKKNELLFFDTATDEKTVKSHRMASGWNALTSWLGSETIGVRYRDPGVWQWKLYVLEDWGIGDADEVGDALYSHDAPDIAVGTRLEFWL